MKTAQTFWDNNQKIEVWFEEVKGTFDFWKKVNGVSSSITERQYLNLVKKYSLKNLLVEYK